MDVQFIQTAEPVDVDIGRSSQTAAAVPDYLLGSSAREADRLILQDQIYRPITRRLFRNAGIGAGMSVLDLGSGAGDVSLLLADLVGPKGRVLGVDMEPANLSRARERIAAAGFRNVEMRQDRVETLCVEPGFDAVVGRWILMHMPDPAEVLRRLATLLKPGGILVFAEMDVAAPPRTFPQSSLDADFSRWIVPPEGAPGPDVRMGTKLYRLFVEAGLAAPEMSLEAPLGGGSDWPGYEYIGETLRSLLPALARVPGFDVAQIDVNALIARLRSEVTASNGVQLLPALIGAWTRIR